MYIGLIKDESSETITLDVNTLHADGSICKTLFVCDKNTIWRHTNKAAYVDGYIIPSNQKNVFFLKRENKDA